MTHILLSGTKIFFFFFRVSNCNSSFFANVPNKGEGEKFPRKINSGKFDEWKFFGRLLLYFII